MKMLKKFSLLCLTVIMFITTFSFYGCKKEEKVEYSVEMGYEVYAEWPEREDICEELRYDFSTDPEYEVLTVDNNEVTVNIDTYKLISVGVEFYIINKATRKIFYTVTPPEEYTSETGRYFYSYQIKDQESGQWLSYEPNRTIYDIAQPGDIFFRQAYNNFELRAIPGEHRLIFHFKLLSETYYFTININIGENELKRPTHFIIEPYEDNYIFFETNYRDVYLMKNGIDSGKPFLPKVGIADGDTIILEPCVPEMGSKGDSPRIKCFFAKADENYMSVMDKGASYPTYYPKGPGVYLVSFTFTGNETYKPMDYVCYMIFPDN